jgi:hypothetical protein
MPAITHHSNLRIDPDDIHDEYDRAGFADLSDAQLFDLAARVIAVPRRPEANSFVLHAPLELMARRLLLPLVPPARQRAVRERMLWVASSYESAAESADPPPTHTFRSVDAARRALLDAVAQGDLDGVDAAASWFVDAATLDDVMALAGPTLDMLAAAGHAPIAFFMLSRVAPTSRSSLMMLRPLLRELARAPQLRMEWIQHAEPPRGDEASFTAALARAPRLGLPGSDFIYPVVHQVDAGAIAHDLINSSIPADVSRAAVATLRVAARSMLQDDPEFAQYGWTHCLTLPQAIFEIIPWLPDAHVAAAAAATYVVAFRSAEGRDSLDTRWVPEPVSADPLNALEREPTVAAAAWYHASDDARAGALPELVARAASHEDAHFAKYTLACLAAAERDPGQRAVYLAAAASLAAWWAQRA